MICELGESDNGNYVVKGVESFKSESYKSKSLKKQKEKLVPTTNSINNQLNMDKSFLKNRNMTGTLNNDSISDNSKYDLSLQKQINISTTANLNNGNKCKLINQHILSNSSPVSHKNNNSDYSKVANVTDSLSINDNHKTEVSQASNLKTIEMRRKYYVKVTPINTKYIAVVKTITNNTPLLLCFEHGKDRHPKEIINLKNSNVYRGVTEKGPCICIRPKNESKYKSIEIVGESCSNKDDKKLKFNNSVDKAKIKENSSNTKIVSSSSSSSSSSSLTTINNQQFTKILSNSVTMYEVECYVDFELWCNFFANIGIVLCNFRSLFHTTKLIGEGSFAKVYKGKNVITGEDVVLKAVDKKKVKESNVYTEIEVLRRVHHPHIVHFIASFEEEDHVCLVLEFLGGGELFEWIAQKGAYSEDQAKIAMKRVLLALQWLHANNVVHRDLKTENLILENKNCPESLKIIDFGLAASLGSSAMKMRCGSPGYVAPEILEDKIYSTKVDVFSIGVVLYTLLGGSPPFPGSNMKEILKKNIQGNVQFTSSRWKNISSSVKDLIKWMMAKDPESRCTAAQAIYHPWFEKIPLNPSLHKHTTNNLSITNYIENKDERKNCDIQNQDQSVLLNEVNNNVTTKSELKEKTKSNNLINNTILKFSNKQNDSINQDSTSNNITEVKYSRDRNILLNKTKEISNNQHGINNIICSNNINNSNHNHDNKFSPHVDKSSLTISSLEYTDSQLSSSINSMKLSPRSIVVTSNQSNRKSITSKINNTHSSNSNNNSLSEKLTEEEEEDLDNDEDDQLNNDYISDNKESIYFNEYHHYQTYNPDNYYYFGKNNSVNNEPKRQSESVNSSLKIKDKVNNVSINSNFQTIYYGAIDDDTIPFERPVIGNIVTSSNIKTGNSNVKNYQKNNRSSSIKAVLQNVFSRFSSNSSNQTSSVNIGRKYDIN